MNMNTEYKQELRQLKSTRRRLWRDLEREVRSGHRERESVVAATTRRLERARRMCERAALQVDRRIAILEGRVG
jgi:hypothetical protein